MLQFSLNKKFKLDIKQLKKMYHGALEFLKMSFEKFFEILTFLLDSYLLTCRFENPELEACDFM